MSPKLGTFIQKHPWLIVIVILAITIGFSLFVPSLKFKTDFEEFTPDDPLVQANTRVLEYFGESQQLLFMLLEKEDAQSVITSDALREMWYLTHELEMHPDINGSFSLVTFLDIICLIEFGESLHNCTDEQISIALDDLLLTYDENPVTLFSENDPNEKVDYQRFPRFLKGSTVDSADIKNCFLQTTNESLLLTFEVYDLSKLDKSLQPEFPRINVMEWYITFNNLICPVEALNITYSLSGHIEPIQPIWEIGKGVIQNVKDILSNLKNRTLFNEYKKEVYLWIQPSGQELAFPIPLKTGLMIFDVDSNQIILNVSLKELGTYGIASQFGPLGLPAKLSHFSAGTRYYQTPLLNLGGGHITANTSYLLQKLFALKSKPLLGPLSERMLQHYGNLTWEEFEDFFMFIQQIDMLPDTITLQDIQDNWKQADYIPDNGIQSKISFTIVPTFYEDLQLSALSFLSSDYHTTGLPSASIMFLQLTPTKDYDKIISMNTRIVENITALDEKCNEVTIKVTGNGIINVQINNVTLKANQLIAPSIFIIIMVILFLNFRGASYVCIPMLSLLISTIWLFGSMALLGISFNVIAVAMVPLIMGLGVDYSVHIFHNYRIELEKGYTPAQAIINCVNDVGTAIFIAMITTVIGFLSFLTATIGPVRDFGILLALGIIYTFITALTLLPALRYLLDK
ncbi:MAG: efflux RND transporter permease subunit, partial [Bacillota bacterium]